MASYLFSLGVRNEKDLKSISVTGCIEIITPEKDKYDSKKPSKKSKKKAGAKKKDGDVQKKRHVPIEPFFTEAKYRPLANDKWIAGYVKMCEETVAGAISDASVPFKLAERWYMEKDFESSMKKRLEPLLLTEVGTDVITLDLTGMPSVSPAIEAYEKMYFNCRDDNFERSKSMQLISRFAMPYGPLKMYLRKWEEVDEDGFCIQDGRPIAKDSDVWRAVAATMGYEALMYVWGWDQQAHGLEDRSTKRMIELSWKASVAKLLSDLYTGNIAHEDAARVLASYTAQLKFISDDRQGGASGEEETSAMLAILYAAAPKMRTLVEGGAGMITDNQIRSRISAQQAIDKTNIQDAGKKVEVDIIDAQIADAVER